MQRMALVELSSKYNIEQISDSLIKKLSLSKADLECFHITNNFILKTSMKPSDGIINIAFSKAENDFVVLNTEEFIGMAWEDFIPCLVCFECDEITALIVVLRYMNQIRATFDDIKAGFEELIKQICKNEIRYKNKD